MVSSSLSWTPQRRGQFPSTHAASESPGRKTPALSRTTPQHAWFFLLFHGSAVPRVPPEATLYTNCLSQAFHSLVRTGPRSGTSPGRHTFLSAFPASALQDRSPLRRTQTAPALAAGTTTSFVERRGTVLVGRNRTELETPGAFPRATANIIAAEHGVKEVGERRKSRRVRGR
jgi:hypothetical protein